MRIPRVLPAGARRDRTDGQWALDRVSDARRSPGAEPEDSRGQHRRAVRPRRVHARPRQAWHERPGEDHHVSLGEAASPLFWRLGAQVLLVASVIRALRPPDFYPTDPP